MTIEAGKTAPIIDDEDQLLSSVWKAKGTKFFEGKTGSFPFGSSGSSGSLIGGPEDPELPREKDRPQLSDIEYLGSETYYDASGMQKAKAKFRIYNSSGESLEKYALALTLSDKQGGTQ